MTTVLIPASEFEEGGAANGRALAYLAHLHLGGAFALPPALTSRDDGG